MTELEILSISDDAARADVVAAHLDKVKPSRTFLDALSRDPYDVIRAEALDCAITGSIPLNREMLRQLAQTEKSQLVRGRLKLYLKLSSLEDELTVIRRRTFADADKRDEPWERACDYCERRDGRSFLAITRFLFDDDYGVAEISLDLLLLLAVGLHRRLLEATVTAAASTRGVRISRQRLAEARELLANESTKPLGLAEIRTQLA